MYLTANEIAESREAALNHLLGLTESCIDAGHRLTELFSSAGREAIHHGSKHCALFGHGQIESLTQFPAALWLENTARSNRIMNGTLVVLGETQKAIIRNAEAQVRVFDHLALSTITRARRSSPWEGEIVLRAMKTTLETAENGLHDISTAAIESVDFAQDDGDAKATESHAEGKPAGRQLPA